jgi:hypothetical protein
MFPRDGEFTLRESDTLDVITKEGPSIAIVIFGGVQYYTGQWFPMKAITNAAKAQVSSRIHTLFYVYLFIALSTRFWALGATSLPSNFRACSERGKTRY